MHACVHNTRYGLLSYQMQLVAATCKHGLHACQPNPGSSPAMALAAHAAAVLRACADWSTSPGPCSSSTWLPPSSHLLATQKPRAWYSGCKAPVPCEERQSVYRWVRVSVSGGSGQMILTSFMVWDCCVSDCAGFVYDRQAHMWACCGRSRGLCARCSSVSSSEKVLSFISRILPAHGRKQSQWPSAPFRF